MSGLERRKARGREAHGEGNILRQARQHHAVTGLIGEPTAGTRTQGPVEDKGGQRAGRITRIQRDEGAGQSE